MQPRNSNAAGTSRGAGDNVKNDEPHLSNSQAKRRKAFPEGWSRWVEPKSIWDVDELLELWGTSIVTLGNDPEVDERELRREFDAWQRGKSWSPLLALCGLFKRAHSTSAIGGKADFPGTIQLRL